MSISIRKKIVENAKLEKFNWDILRNFQPMWNFQSQTKEENIDKNHRGAKKGAKVLVQFSLIVTLLGKAVDIDETTKRLLLIE